MFLSCSVRFCFYDFTAWLSSPRQIKDILKGALRFNQSQLESEENEEITIADDHYTAAAAAAAAAAALNTIVHHSEIQPGEDGRRSRDPHLDGCVSTDESDEEEPAMTSPEQQVSSL